MKTHFIVIKTLVRLIPLCPFVLSGFFLHAEKKIDSLTSEEKSTSKPLFEKKLLFNVKYDKCEIFPINDMALIQYKEKLSFLQLAKVGKKNKTTLHISTKANTPVQDVTYELRFSKKYHKNISFFKIGHKELYIFIAYNDGTLRILKKNVIKKKGKIKFIYKQHAETKSSKSKITHLDISQNSQMVLVANEEGNIVVWDIQNTSNQWTYKSKKPITHIRFSPDATFIVFFDNTPTFYLATIPKLLAARYGQVLLVNFEIPLKNKITLFETSKDTHNQIFVWTDSIGQIAYFKFIDIGKNINLNIIKEKSVDLKKMALDEKHNMLYTIEGRNTIAFWNLNSNKRLLTYKPATLGLENLFLRNDNETLFLLTKENILIQKIIHKNIPYHHLLHRYSKKINYAVKKWKKQKDYEAFPFYIKRITRQNFNNYIDYYTNISLNKELANIFYENKNSAKILKKANGKTYLSFSLLEPIEVRLHKNKYKTLSKTLSNLNVKSVDLSYTKKGIVIKNIIIQADNQRFKFKNRKSYNPGVLHLSLKDMNLSIAFDKKLKRLTLKNKTNYFQILPLKDSKLPLNKNPNPANKATVLIIDNWFYDALPCTHYSSLDAQLYFSLFTKQFGIKKQNIYFYENTNHYALSKILFSNNVEKKTGMLHRFKKSENKHFIFCFLGRNFSNDKESFILPIDANPNSNKKMFSWKDFFIWSKKLKAEKMTIILETTLDKKNIENLLAKDSSSNITVFISNSNTNTHNHHLKTKDYYLFTQQLCYSIVNPKLANKNKDKILSLTEIIDFFAKKEDEYKSTYLNENKNQQQKPSFISSKTNEPFFYY